MHDNLIREREGGRLPLEVRLGSQVDIVTQMTKWTRNINLTLNIGLRVSGLSFGFSGSPCLVTNLNRSFRGPKSENVTLCTAPLKISEQCLRTKLVNVRSPAFLASHFLQRKRVGGFSPPAHLKKYAKVVKMGEHLSQFSG